MKLARMLQILRQMVAFRGRAKQVRKTRLGELRARFRRLLVIEGLESRRALAFSIASSGNSITLTGDASDDAVVISVAPSGHFRHDLSLVGNLVSNIDTDGSLAGEQAILASSVSSMVINGNAGNDTIDASLFTGIGIYVDAGAGNDIVTSGSGNDSLRGGPGNDILKSGAGNDDLRGGSGNDILEGGAGGDTVDWHDYDQAAGDDILRGGDGNDNLAGGPSVGDLFYGGDGSDTASAGGITQLTLTDSDYISSGIVSANHSVESWILYGTNNDDTIDASLFTGIGIYVDAGAGNDIVTSGSGNDSLRGGPGNDILKSGAGNDDLRGGSGNDILEGGAGGDTVDWHDYDQAAGDDILRGGDGNDNLASGPSVGDLFYGGDGSDTASAGGITQLMLTDSDYISSGIVSANHSVESWILYGTNNDDTIDASLFTGIGIYVDAGAGNDIVTSGSGNDSLRGGPGNDILKSGAGNDDLRGGSGNDILEGGAGGDTVDWHDYDQAAGDDILRGGDGNDNLASGPSVGDLFYGGDGSDTASAGGITQLMLTDSDYISSGIVSANHSVESWILYGTNNDDTIDASLFTGIGIYVDAGAGNDIVTSGSGSDSLRGGPGNDILKSGAGNDDLRGGSGNDILEGGAGGDTVDWHDYDQAAGDDILRGGDGNDNLASGPSVGDLFYGGDGSDTASAGGITQLTLTDSDYISSGIVSANHSVESWILYGTNNDDTIDASLFTGIGIYVDAGAGNDIVTSGSGSDSLRGGPGNDILKSGAGNDDLRGGSGNDILEGGAGGDTVDWHDYDQAAGDDILRGGDGNDNLASGPSVGDLFYGGDGSDTASAGGITQLTLTDSDYISSGIVSANHSVESWILYGTNNDDSIDSSGWTGNGILIYGYGGNDILKGGTGNDSIYGGDGNDDIAGGGGQDYLNGQAGNDTIRVQNSSFSQVLGESGNDRFAIIGSGVSIDLVSNSTSYMQGIEEIDLTGSGNNSLTINQSRVLSLSDTTDTLIVSADVGDTVNRDSGWTTTGTETINGSVYKVQTNGAATLKVQQSTDFTLRRQIQQLSYSFDNPNTDGFSGPFGVVGVQGYQGLGPASNTFNSNFLKSSDSATLTLSNLPQHDSIDIGFLLAIIDSWDGRNGDYFNVLVDGATVFREAFHYSNQASQSYLPPSGGLISFGTQLGFASWSDAGYDMNKEPRLQRISHSGSSLTITWLANGPNWQGGTDEFWAIDNLKLMLWSSDISVPSDAAANYAVGQLRTQDIDPSNSFTYSLVSGPGDTDNALFSITGNEIRTSQALTSPTRTSYSIRVRAMDANNIPFDKTLLIPVVNSNAAPVDIQLSSTSIAENSLSNTTIGNLTTTDPNVGDTFTYSLASGTGDNDNSAFNISGNTLHASNSFDFETKSSYTIRIRSTDQGGLFTEKTFTVTVTDVNEGPTDIVLTPATILENAGVNASVGTLSSVDPDAANSFTYSLVTGTGDTDNGLFNISGNTLRANNSFNFEVKSSYSIRVRTVDQGGLIKERVFTIQVTDVNENPTDISLSSTSIPENLGNNATVGTLITTDPDSSDSFTYTLASGSGDTDNSAFNIDGNTLRATNNLDYEVKNVYSIRVRSTDGGGLWTEKAFTINVQDANDIAITRSGNSINIQGGLGADSMIISISPAGYLQHNFPLAGNLVSFLDTDSVTAGEQLLLASDVTGIVISSRDGDDVIDASSWTGIGISIYSGLGNDTIQGGSGNDTLVGGNGNDTIEGNAGDDFIVGDDYEGHNGTGDDTLRGGDGNDTLYGDSYIWWSGVTGTGNDVLDGGNGDDSMNGAGGGNAFLGGAGVDSVQDTLKNNVILTNNTYTADGVVSNNHGVESFKIFGTDGNDIVDASAWTGIGISIYSGLGNDTIQGGSGNDTLVGGNGNDTIEGNAGDDFIVGDDYEGHNGTGDDTLRGGDGNDTLYGDSYIWWSGVTGTGNDVLDGGNGDDSMNGAGGGNAFLGGAGVDSVQDTLKNNVILTNNTYTADGVVSNNHGVESFKIFGTDGNDIVDASAWTGIGISIYSGLGNDTIQGGSGNDTLVGGNGNDTIEGNAGDDFIVGDDYEGHNGTGDDTLRGGDGNDTLYGDSYIWWSGVTGTGNDVLDGGNGDDSMNGAGGGNAFLGGAGVDSVQDTLKNNVILTNNTYTADGVVSNNHGVESFKIFGTDGNDIVDASAWTGIGAYIEGGPGNDILQGGAGNDSIFGGDGDDSISGSGGSDYLNGQAGNDFIRVPNSSFSQVLGESGNDRFAITGSGISIDLVSNPTSYMQGIEEIDLTGSGNNSLTVNQSRVLSLSDTTDTLIVSANVGDTVNRGSGWITTGTETINGSVYKVQTNGAAILKVQQATDVNLVLLPLQEVQTLTYSLNNANPDDFSGSFSVVPVQGYQGIGATSNTFDASFLKSSSSATLTLTNLPEHDRIDVGFLLAIIDSWDGNDRGFPTGDFFNVLVDGAPIFRETFSSFSLAEQSYTAPIGGLLSFGSQLSFGGFADSAYNMFLEPKLQQIAHRGSTLTITWLANGPGWQGGEDESWAIDNLSIKLWKGQTSIPNNLTPNALIGRFESTDVQPEAMFSYSLVSGTDSEDNSYFTISGDELKVAQALDTSKTSYAIRVRATDSFGVTFEKPIVINARSTNQAPTDISLSATSIAENTGANAAVGTLTTTDPDAANTFTYTLVLGTGDTDNAAFNIDDDTLRVNSSFDFETKSSYSVRVRSTDQGSLWTEKVFTISVTDVNEIPTNINLSANSIAENSGANATVGTLTTTDPDTANTFTYTLVSGTGDTDNAAFNLSGNALRASSSFDFETKSSYSVRVRSTDQGGLWTEKVFTISVTDVNETPTNINLSANSIAENSGANATVGTLTTTDPDTANTFTYTLVSGSGSTDNAAFNISSNTLLAISNLDYETMSIYSIRVRSTDHSGLFTEKVFVVKVTNINETPTELNISSLSIAENSGTDAFIGSLNTVDDYYRTVIANFDDFPILPAINDYANLSDLNNGSNNYAGVQWDSRFQIVGRNYVELWVNQGPNTYAKPRSASFASFNANGENGLALQTTKILTGAWFGRVDLGNGPYGATQIIIHALNGSNTLGTVSMALNSTTPSFMDTSLFLNLPGITGYRIDRVAQSGGIASRLGSWIAEDFAFADPSASNFTYTLVSGSGSTDNAAFNISGNALRASSSFDFETKSSYSVRVRSTDQGGLWTEKVFTISVTDVNETPTNISLSASSIAENAGANATVGTLSTTDPDALNTFTYSLVSGSGSTDNAAFNISGNALRASSSFDFDTKSSYSVRVRSTDQGGLWTEKVFTISVTDVNETPTNISLSASSIAENAGANATVGTLSTTDPDALNTFTYSLVSGSGSTDNAAFNISGNALRASSSFDFETKSSYSVRVRSTDQGGLYTEKVFTINVINTNELVSVTVNGADNFINARQRSQITSVVVVTESVLSDPQTAFSLTNIGLLTASSSSLASSQILVTSVGNVYTLRFGAGAGVVAREGTGARANSLADGNWILTVAGSEVSGTNQFGNRAVDNFFRMFGDSDGDGDVDGTDAVALRRAQIAASYNAAMDWDGNGSVTSGADINYFSLNQNKRRRLF
jgi:Ca2+-binding RTX toxin-like protein